MSEIQCPICGGMTYKDAKFCSFCGAEVKNIPEEPRPNQNTYRQPEQTYQPQPPRQPTYQTQPDYNQRRNVNQQPNYNQQPTYNQSQPLTGNPNNYPGMPQFPKDRITAGIIALLLGGIGVHKFYIGKIASGVLYLLFCWTGIPLLISFIEGIIYLVENDEEFQYKHVPPEYRTNLPQAQQQYY